MSAVPPVCILAGGRGTRLGSRVADVPKPLLDVAGEPFLFHQMRLLAAHGAERVVLCVGYLGDVIERTVGKERFGITIEYRYDGDELLGTLGAVRSASDLLGDCFLVLYGDTYLRVDYAAAAEHWRSSACLGLMTVLRNEGRWDVSNAVFEDDRVVSYDKEHPTPEMQWIDYGLGGLRQAALSLVGDDEQDLSALYRRLATMGELCGFEAKERFYEIGSPASLQEAEAFLRSQVARRAT